MNTQEKILALAQSIKDDLESAITRQKFSPTQVAIVSGLSDISNRLGLITAGEFRSGNGKEPGYGFSGVRMGYPSFRYLNDDWNIVGVENDSLQFGLRSSDGKAVFLNGDVTIGSDGIYGSLLSWMITQVADDGITYRKGRLGMTTFEDETAPSFGLDYSDNTTPTELVTNGDFATGDFTGWTAVDGTWQITSGHAYANCGDIPGEKKQIVNTSAPQLSFGATLWGQGGRVHTHGITLDFYSAADGGGSLLESRVMMSNVNQNGVLTYSLPVTPPTGTLSVAIRLLATAGGSGFDVYFDDISLYAVALNSQFLLTGSGPRYIENGVTYYPVSQGWLPYAFPPWNGSVTAVSTQIAVAANGGSLATNIQLSGPMLLQAVTVRNGNTTSARTWNWGLYRQKSNTGVASENTLTRVAVGEAAETFTAGAASNRTIDAANAPVILVPGSYWLVVQCQHATNAFNVQAMSANLIFPINQEKVTTNPNGETLDFVAATWTKSGEWPYVYLKGRVFGETTAF